MIMQLPPAHVLTVAVIGGLVVAGLLCLLWELSRAGRDIDDDLD